MKIEDKEILSVWKKVLNIIKPQLPEATYEMCFASCEPTKIDGNQFFIEVSNMFVKGMIIDKHKILIEGILSGLMGFAVSLDITIRTTPILTRKPENEKKQKKKSINKKPAGIPLNPKYTFDSFVSGKSNEFAYAVSNAASESPGKLYNPLFIYGGVGLGKTHLLQAIGHHILERKPKTSLIYVSAEEFMNDLISSIKNKNTPEFRKKYRKADLLLMDDVQLLAGRIQTQEEFFHTFNELFQRNKQIVLTSDRPPKRLAQMEDRLVNRFEHGLIADVQPPDLELRIAILKKEAEDKEVEVTEEILAYIAERVESNIRELQGAFTRLVAYSSIEKSFITRELVDRILGDLIKFKKQKINVEYIKNLVADYYEVTVADLISKKRSNKITHPRQVAIYLIRTILDLPLQLIGEKFGGRDHTTIMHSISKIEDMMNRNLEFKNEIEIFEKNLSI